MSSNNAPNRSHLNTVGTVLAHPLTVADANRLLQQPRQPRNLQGLLRFAMEATKAEDAPGNSQLGPMTEENRKFLEQALKSLTVDVIEVLQNAIKVLSDSEKIRSIQLGQLLPADVKTAFDNILDCVDDIDAANDFYKLGGFSIFPICFGSENDEVRSNAYSVLAELCQNNPYCQNKAFECGLHNILFNLLSSEKGLALSKCLYAISCATRECEPACRELIAQGGCELIINVLRATDEESVARTKAAFFIRYLCRKYGEAKEQFLNLGIVRTTAELIKNGRDDAAEHLLSILLEFADDSDPTILQQMKDPNIGLKKILEEHLQKPELTTERYIEEKEYCQDILKQVFQNCPEVDAYEEIADR